MKHASFKTILPLIAFIALCGVVIAQSLNGNPTSNNRQTSPFGTRASTNSNHLAVDYGARTAGVGGDSISSTHGGTVVESRYQSNGRGGWGNTVVVESASGNYRTRYSHMQDGTRIVNGTTIAPGQQVGLMGGTGKPGGYTVHLDYAVMVKDPATGKFYPIDPNEAAGKDLDDPAVRGELIADAKTKIDGDLNASGDPKGGVDDTSADSGSGSDAMIGCDPTIYDKNKTRVKALRQQESEAARKLITKPVSVQQLSCFDQYAKTNAEQIGSIRSNPGGNISASINPIVKDPALLNLAANFTGGNIPGLGEVQNVLNGGLQSMMNNALGGLTGGLFGAPGGAQGCNAMDEMFKLMECMDFPEMPSLPDILGGGAGALGTLGSGQSGGGVMGAICQAVKGSFGGGGSGGTDVYENLLNATFTSQ